MAGPLAAHALPGEAAQLVVDQWHQQRERRLVAASPLQEQLCDVARHLNPLRLLISACAIGAFSAGAKPYRPFCRLARPGSSKKSFCGPTIRAGNHAYSNET